LGSIAQALPKGMTGADMYSLCSDAYMTAIAGRISKMHSFNPQFSGGYSGGWVSAP